MSFQDTSLFAFLVFSRFVIAKQGHAQSVRFCPSTKRYALSFRDTTFESVFKKKSVFLEAIKAETHLKQRAFSKERITLRA